MPSLYRTKFCVVNKISMIRLFLVRKQIFLLFNICFYIVTLVPNKLGT